jgi:hypothetical protein
VSGGVTNSEAEKYDPGDRRVAMLPMLEQRIAEQTKADDRETDAITHLLAA